MTISKVESDQAIGVNVEIFQWFEIGRFWRRDLLGMILVIYTFLLNFPDSFGFFFGFRIDRKMIGKLG